MPGPKPILDDAFVCTDTAIAQYVAAQIDTAAAGACKGGSLNCKLLGVAQEATAAAGRRVALRTHGITRAIASGVIAYGDRVACDANGKFKSVEATVAAGLANPAAVVEVAGIAYSAAGQNGDIFFLKIHPQTVALAVS